MGIDFGGLLALIWRYREDVELIKQAIGVYERGVVRRDEVGSQFINNGVNPNRMLHIWFISLTYGFSWADA